MKTLFSGLPSKTCKQTLKKFQAIVLGRKAYNGCKSFRVSDTDIKCEESVKLLGVTVDYLLNFDLHISNMCKKAAKQINVLLRLSNYIKFQLLSTGLHFCFKSRPLAVRGLFVMRQHMHGTASQTK